MSFCRMHTVIQIYENYDDFRMTSKARECLRVLIFCWIVRICIKRAERNELTRAMSFQRGLICSKLMVLLSNLAFSHFVNHFIIWHVVFLLKFLTAPSNAPRVGARA